MYPYTFQAIFIKKNYCLKYYSLNRIPMREDFPTTLKSMILLTWMWTRARWRFRSNTHTGDQIFLRGSGSALKESKRLHHWRNCHPFLFFLRSDMSWRLFLTFFVAWNIIINNVHIILQIGDRTNIFGMSSEGIWLRKNLFFGLMKLNFSKQLWQCRRFSEYQVLIRNLTKFSFNYNMQRMEAMSLLGVALILSRYFPSCFQSQMWVTNEIAIFHTFVFSCISATSRVISVSSTTRGQVLFLSHS